MRNKASKRELDAGSQLHNAVHIASGVIELFADKLVERFEQEAKDAKNDALSNVACGLTLIRCDALEQLDLALNLVCEELSDLHRENQELRARLAPAPTPPTVAA